MKTLRRGSLPDADVEEKVESGGGPCGPEVEGTWDFMVLGLVASHQITTSRFSGGGGFACFCFFSPFSSPFNQRESGRRCDGKRAEELLLRKGDPARVFRVMRCFEQNFGIQSESRRIRVRQRDEQVESLSTRFTFMNTV